MSNHYDAGSLAADLATIAPGYTGDVQCWADHLYQLVLDGNEVGNLTRILDRDEFYVKHLLDSLLGLAVLPQLTDAPWRIADVGCGAGFPGLVLAQICSQAQFVEIDSNSRKVNFVASAGQALGLGDRLQAIHGRARELGRRPDLNRSFDLITARAVADAGDLIRECRQLLKPGGQMLLYKTPEAIAKELPIAQREAKKLGMTIVLSDTHQLPFDMGSRQWLQILP